jgi:uncharacterized repeat protein (TIGR03803 family)
VSHPLGSVVSPAVTLTVTLQPPSVLHSFIGNPDGAIPSSNLIQSSDGNFYGTTQSGGYGNSGGLYKISPDGAELVIYSFNGGTYDGALPSSVIQGIDGNFYGTTYGGGPNNYGAVFKITPAGFETVLHIFAGGSDGWEPIGNMIQGADGNFYGVTAFGGANSHGIVFMITPTGVETVLYSFGSGNDGQNPQAGLTLGSDGNFYGTTEQGGTG